MKKVFTHIMVSGLMVFAFYSCSKDLGNYDYSDANVITITTDMANVDPTVVVNSDSIVVKQNDSLKVNILLSQTKPSNDLSYEWMITQTAASIANPPQYVVGNSQQLRTKIILLPNLYKLVVKVTDKTTGVSFYKFYQLNVDTNPWGGEGWIVLQDQPFANGSDISVITTRDGAVRGTVYSNVYSSANNGNKLPVGTYKVNVMSYNTTLRIQKVSFFYPNGGLQVKSTDFADSSFHESWFLDPPASYNFQVNGQVSGGQYEYVINNNQLYYRRVNAATVQAPPIKFGAPVLGTWTLSPFVINNSTSEQWYTLYDQANRCFVLYNAETGALYANRPDVANSHFLPYSGAAAALHPTTGSGFDLNNIGRNLVHAENSQPMSSSTTYNSFFRNNNGDSTWLYQFNAALAYNNNFTTGRYFLSNTNVPGINTATMFACPTFLTAPGKFYYVNNNNIYIGEVKSLATSTATIGYTFPAGTIIKAMKVFKSGYVTAPSSEGRVLVVATDETSSGGGHKVYFFNLSATGTITSPAANIYTGFDKITDIVFKKGVAF
ncbi:MAG TPA: PKD-like family lipoprotein [Chitinophagaceae bacterium]